MKKLLEKLFLNEHLILVVIIINAASIYAQASGYDPRWVEGVDVACCMLFLIEMLVKQFHYGFRRYWRNSWNKLDGSLVIISLPSVLAFFMPTILGSLNVLLVIRLLRIIRLFRVMHFFPSFPRVIGGLKRAMNDSYAILLSYVVVVVMWGLLNCSFFSEADPVRFGSPLLAIYSSFQICTVDGWYEIPNALAEYYGVTSSLLPHLIRAWFCILLIAGGVIGMSFINSVFVDAMVEDNNDDVIKKLDELSKKVDELNRKLGK